MKSKRKYLSRVMMFSSALVLAFLATNTAQAEEHNDVFYSRYRPGFNYYNPRARNNYNYGRYPGYYNPWYNYNVFYWNGNYYYKNQNGDYYVYKNGKWELYYQDGFNKLKNDPHYRYENGYHYYVFDDGSYYYYENGKWVYVKKAEDPTPEPNPTPDPKPDPETPKPEKPDWAPNPNIDYSKLPKPLYRPDDPRMKSDPRFVDDNGTYYYRVHLGDENPDGIDGYYKWMGDRWKLFNGTDPDDPALDPNNHSNPKDDEYNYDDNASTVKLYSENLVGTGKAGDPLPFKNKEEFISYVQQHLAPKMIDNAGYDCKVTYELEEEDVFNQAVDHAWARDYVLTAYLTSSVKGYEKTEFGHVKFIYRVEKTENSNFPNIDKAKAALAKLNAERRRLGLQELTWSDELYNNQSLPTAQKLSVNYDSSAGITFRREENAEVVANKWLNSGNRELILNPDAKEGAVACVQAGDGTYYWVFNYK